MKKNERFIWTLIVVLLANGGCNPYLRFGNHICPDGRVVSFPKDPMVGYKNDLTGYFWAWSTLIRTISNSNSFEGQDVSKLHSTFREQERNCKKLLARKIMQLNTNPCDSQIYSSYLKLKREVNTFGNFLIDLNYEKPLDRNHLNKLRLEIRRFEEGIENI